MAELLQLSRDSEASTFAEDSPIRQLIRDWRLGPDISQGLIGLRWYILVEITSRLLD